MKTAEQWLKEADESNAQFAENYEDWRVNFTKQIQLDAMREGMRMAADKIQSREDLKQSILSAAEQLTEKDL